MIPFRLLEGILVALLDLVSLLQLAIQVKRVDGAVDTYAAPLGGLGYYTGRAKVEYDLRYR